MKSNLENILLPSLKKAKPKQDKFAQVSEIEHRVEFLESNLSGDFLDEAKSVFLIQKKYELTQPEKEVEENILKYAKSDPIGWENLLFIDTETTGLSRGTGTYVFLVGIGFWQQDCFCEEIYFLADLSGEKLMMDTILQRIGQFKTFVSYNGKSFDIPLLQTRFIMNEIDFDLKQIPNLDLLHLTRRFLRNRFDSFSLQNMEKYLLGIKRNMEHDIPGSEIPKVYLDFLSDIFSDKIPAIVNHNQQDILSLTVLLDKLNEFLILAMKGENIPADYTGIGRFLEDMENLAAAENVYKSCPFEETSCRKNLSYILKKNCRIEEAIELWKEAAKANEVYAMVELAMDAEHARGKFAVALGWCEKAIAEVSSGFWVDQELLTQLVHRKSRLLSKLQNS